MNDLMNELVTADTRLFLWLTGLHTPAMDTVMWWISYIPLLGVIYALIGASMFYRRPWKAALVAFVFMCLAMGASDFVGASIIRPLVARMRPCNPDNPISGMVHILHDYRAGKYGFPSCHAANTFAVAVFYCLYRRKRWITALMLAWAVVVCYSRICLGVHYPGDLLCGAAIGSLMAWGSYTLMKKALKTNFMKRLGVTALIVSAVAMPHSAVAQDTSEMPADTVKAENPYKFRPVQLALPVALIGIGVVGVESDWLKWHNNEIRDELQEDSHKRFTIDDFTQLAPTAAVYALDLCGVKGTHDAVDQTIILGTAAALMGATVLGMKSAFHVLRPDGSSYNSFPSGHTATAFMGAEFLRREYWKVSPWIGIAGYAVATGTGFFRMYNNRHWLTDVIAGAGIGILSVEAAYWLYPLIAKTLFKKRYRSNVYLAPYAGVRSGGLALSVRF